MEENNVDKRKQKYEQHKKGNKTQKRWVKCLKCDRSVYLKKPFHLCPRCRMTSSNYAIEDHSIGSY